MSEYQFYEFQSIDRPLTQKEQKEIGSWSGRTTPTSTHAIFTYSYSDFPKSPEKVVEKYFDAMLYITNWGTKRLMFRFPRSIINTEVFNPYCLFDSVSTSVTDDYIILDICIDNEEGGGEWVEGEGCLSSLIMLRNDILNGDYRMLYLAWLKSINIEPDIEDFEEELEPAVPDNLGNLSAPLQSFIEVFEIDNDLICAASKGSASNPDSTLHDIEKLITKLTEKERIDFLIRFAKGEPHANLYLQKRLRNLSLEKIKINEPSQKRIIGALLKTAREIFEHKKEKKQQQAELARIRKFQELEKQEAELWEQAIGSINTKSPKSYDEAVKILKDLRDLARYQKKIEQFKVKINKIHKDFSRLSGLKSRLNHAGLSG